MNRGQGRSQVFFPFKPRRLIIIIITIIIIIIIIMMMMITIIVFRLTLLHGTNLTNDTARAL